MIYSIEFYFLLLNVKDAVSTNVTLLVEKYIEMLARGQYQTDKIRTTRTPVFWGFPPPPHDYPFYWVILDPKSGLVPDGTKPLPEPMLSYHQ